MKIFGVLLLVIGAVVFGREKIKKQEEKLLLLEELYRFIEQIKIEAECYLRPPSSSFKGFSSEFLSECGFLDDAKTLGVSKAYERLCERFLFSDEEKKILDRFFGLFGKSFIDGEIELMVTTLSKLGQLVSIERERMPKYKKLVSALSLAFSFSLAILLI